MELQQPRLGNRGWQYSWKSGEVAQQRKTSLPKQTSNQKIDTWEKDLGKPQGTRNFRLLQQKMWLVQEDGDSKMRMMIFNTTVV